MSHCCQLNPKIFLYNAALSVYLVSHSLLPYLGWTRHPCFIFWKLNIFIWGFFTNVSQAFLDTDIREKLSESNIFRAGKTTRSSYIINQTRFHGFCCKSNMPLLIRGVPLNYLYGPFKEQIWKLFIWRSLNEELLKIAYKNKLLHVYKYTCLKNMLFSLIFTKINTHEWLFLYITFKNVWQIS